MNKFLSLSLMVLSTIYLSCVFNQVEASNNPSLARLNWNIHINTGICPYYCGPYYNPYYPPYYPYPPPYGCSYYSPYWMW